MTLRELLAQTAFDNIVPYIKRSKQPDDVCHYKLVTIFCCIQPLVRLVAMMCMWAYTGNRMARSMLMQVR